MSLATSLDHLVAAAGKTRRSQAEACHLHLSDLIGADRATLRMLAALAKQRRLTDGEKVLREAAEGRLGLFRYVAVGRLEAVR